MSDSSRSGNPFLIFLRWLWNFIDGARRLVLNVVFLLIIMLVLALMLQTPLPPKPGTALVVQPVGFVVEQYTSDPFERAMDSALGDEEPETRFRDLVRAIQLAKHDDAISVLVIDPDSLWAIGPAQLHELKRVVDSFRESGKPVYAYSEGMEQHQYFLASLADEVWLHPEGLVFLQGYGVYRNYYQEALDKLNVDIHLFRVGEYKSAAEPFVRNDMSEESRAANRYWLADLWDSFIEVIADRRGLSPDQMRDIANSYADKLRLVDGAAAKMAMAQGLVDHVDSKAAFAEFVAGVGASDGHGGFEEINHQAYLALQLPESPLKPRVGVVIAEGAIAHGDQPPGTIGGDSTVRQIRAARRDESVKAIVLRVNSPGGSVLPSEKIRQELALARSEGKPVIVSMGTVAASGGYWISMAADSVLAESTTITGSIGIFGMFATIPETLANLGIHTDGVGTTPLAGAFRMDRELPEQAADVIQLLIEDGYRSFIRTVSESRGLSEEAVNKVARGRVWSGAQALERGLIDQLGGLTDAVALAAEKASISGDYATAYFEEAPTEFEQWLLDLSADAPLAAFKPDRPSWLTAISKMPSELTPFLQAANQRPAVFAHCMCALSHTR